MLLLLSACANVLPQHLKNAPYSQPHQTSLPKFSDAPLVQLFEQKQQAHNRISLNQPIQSANLPMDTAMPKKLPNLRGLINERMAERTGEAADSAVYPLSNGVEAFAARSALIKHAKYSLDLQYYTLQKGLSSRLLLREVVIAADRGVRVRILLDDREQLGRDKEMLVLNAHPNIEVRLFNPIKRYRSNIVSRWMVFLSNLSSLRRRMHIKMWLADGVLGITGGRNLGDRYFNAGDADNFSDMDVLLGGTVVDKMQAGFDDYWNSEQVMSVDAFDSQHIDMRREQISQMIFSTSKLTQLERVSRHPYLQALKDTEQEMLPIVLSKVTWGQVEFLIDPPSKINHYPDPAHISLSEDGEIRMDTPVFDNLIRAMSQAKKEVLIVSPYFLPGDELTQFLINLHNAGVRITILSNSLQSNDVPVVNGHYDYYRDRLLQAGIAMYELRGYPDVPAQPQWRHPIFSIKGSRTALHSKVVVIDGQTSFVGSMNLDPCSVTGNTEVGVLIQQPAFAEQMRQLFLTQLDPKYSFEMRQNQGKTVWYLGAESNLDETQTMRHISGTTLKNEPGSLWRKLQKYIGTWLPEHYM
ncbi:MAG: clsC [Burkholderiaceae bacterium]|nr:clsC [Burkholderiaceae bacterium]